MIFVTGDCHGDYRRFNTKRFPEQKGMTKDDFVIILGDFGLWRDTLEERYWLDWLNDRPFTTLFVDGNHENFDRLYSDEFPIMDFHGGKAHQIRPSIYHLMRGEVFTLQGKQYFAFGGASSHDIDGGILDRADYENASEYNKAYLRMSDSGLPFRVNHLSWWEQELPSDEEMAHGREKLDENHWHVDFVLTHCLPQSIASVLSMGGYKPDKLTMYFQRLIDDGLEFGRWFCGHYHIRQYLLGGYTVLYHDIKQID